MVYGKTVNNGTPDGIISASLSNWNGVCIKAPRSEISRKDYEELDAPGVYFLVCTDTDDGQDAVYIGEAENVRSRLNIHIQDYSSGREIYYWQNAVVFTGSELNKTLIRYLEHNLTMKAKVAKRYTVLTKNTYSNIVYFTRKTPVLRVRAPVTIRRKAPLNLILLQESLIISYS